MFACVLQPLPALEVEPEWPMVGDEPEEVSAAVGAKAACQDLQEALHAVITCMPGLSI